MERGVAALEIIPPRPMRGEEGGDDPYCAISDVHAWRTCRESRIRTHDCKQG